MLHTYNTIQFYKILLKYYIHTLRIIYVIYCLVFKFKVVKSNVLFYDSELKPDKITATYLKLSDFFSAKKEY